MGGQRNQGILRSGGEGAYALFLGFIALAVLVGSPLLPWEQFPPGAYASEAERAPYPGQEDSLKRAVFVAGRLWLLSDQGELYSVREGKAGARNAAPPLPVTDLCVQEGELFIATRTLGKTSTQWVLWRRAGEGWTELARVPRRGELLAALGCDSGGISLVTSARLITVSGGKQAEKRLSQRVPANFIGASLQTPQAIFLGVNAGEFGGGMMRVDRRTGETVRIESNVSGDLCGGPLNSGCDPVNGIAASPWSPGCVIAAVGLVHMSAHGRIVEVCGETVRRLYFQPCPGDPDKELRPGRDEPYCTVSFSGLARSGDSLLAIGFEGLHSLDAAGGRRLGPLPKFQPYGPFQVSFEGPGYVLVLTSRNKRFSVSGLAPLLVPR